MKRVLCTGSGGSATTNFIRSLRMAPEPFYIVGVDTSKYYLELSKADKNFVIPGCKKSDYFGELNKIIDSEGIEFLHCQPDTEVEVLSKHKDLLMCNTFLPPYEDVMMAHDKLQFNRLMSDNDVNVPMAWGDVAECPFDGETKFWLRAKSGAGSLAALPVTTKEQADMWIKYWGTRGLSPDDFMISEYLPGKEYAFQSVWKDGELITSACRQRIEYLFQNRMPSGQSSTPTVAKTVHDNWVNAQAVASIRTLSKVPNGVYCVDIKEDKNMIPCITEINLGRFFTTSLFFTVAGSNMPYLYTKLAYGERIDPQPRYNAVPEDLWWVRQIDCGEAICKEGEWKSL